MELIQVEILEQRALARRRAELPPPVFPEAPGRRIVTGCGDSLAAAELAAALYPERRLEALPAMPASAAARGLGPDDLLVAISVSGRTPRVVEAARRARAAGAQVVAVTDDPTSALAAEAGLVWTIEASPTEELQRSSYADPDAAQYVGYHRDVAQTKTFLGAVLALGRAAEGEGGPTDWGRLAGTVERLTEEAFAAPLRALGPRLAEAGQSFALATGAALPLARFASYKLLEYDRVAFAADLEEYCHTHYFVTREGDALLLVLHDEEAALRADEIAPVLVELFRLRCAVARSDDVPAIGVGEEVVVPAGGSPLERSVALLVALEWLTYLQGRVGLPSVDTFHGGRDTERLVAGSLRTIRRSAIRP